MPDSSGERLNRLLRHRVLGLSDVATLPIKLWSDVTSNRVSPSSSLRAAATGLP